MNTIRGYLALILLCGSVFAQTNPTAADIQTDFDQIFTTYYAAAATYIGSLVTELNARVDDFVAAHQLLADQLNNITSINNLVLDDANKKIITDGVASIAALIATYRTTLASSVVTDELNRQLDMIKANVSTVQSLITSLEGYVTANPDLGQCWTSSKDSIVSVISNGFSSARDAAVYAISNANATLNLIELLASSTVDSNNAVVAACQLPADFDPTFAYLNSCIPSFLSTAQITLPANIASWSSIVSSAVTTNLQIADSLVSNAAAFALANVPFLQATVQACLISLGATIG